MRDVDTPLLEINDASVVLGGSRILDGLTLTIRAGEHTAILGPNGAGKSTLMKLLTLQLYPFAGSNTTAPLDCARSGPLDSARGGPERSRRPPVRVFGRERWDVFDLRTQLGIVSADLHDRFVHGNAAGVITGHDAVLSGFFASQGLFSHSRVTDAMRRQAIEALDSVGAAQLAAATLDTMSTGEARRVLIARALVHKPKALVLDEPTRGLDLVAQHHFMERVRSIAQGGTTIVLVTHHVDEIIPEIDRVILLSRGRVAYDGAKSAVLTAANLSAVFDASLTVENANGYYTVHVAEKRRTEQKEA
jgi:iron complex transport system ATP-binding protein